MPPTIHGMKRSPILLLAAGLASLAAAPAAMADSIVYIDGGNVWSASPDGSRKVQLTDGGDWHSPTQADDGTIAAVEGTGPIVVMARDGRPLVFGGSGSQVSIDDLGGGDYSFTPWITPDAHMGDGKLSRDGTRLAATFDYGDNTQVVFFAVKGDARTENPPPAPDLACNTSSGDARHGDPSWSPDGSSIAYESSKGIEIGHFTRLDASGCETTGGDQVLSATGSQPEWGPADPPAARWTPPPAAQPLQLLTAQTSQKALRGGMVVKVHVPAAGKVTVRMGIGKRTFGKGSATAKAPGDVKVRLAGVEKARAARLSGRTVTFVATQAGATVTGTVALK